MNMKEMEQLVRSLQDAVNGQGQAMTEMRAVINEQAVQLAHYQELKDCTDGMNDTLFGVHADVEQLKNWIGAGDADGPFYPEFKALTAKVDELTAMVEGRNKSAPTKRNMTDEDAIRVLTGDLKDLSHKDAGDAATLTYAQVYSCRLEYTFKHVHKALRDADPEYKNKWAK